MPKKRKAPVGEWYKGTRKINGHRRQVLIKRLSNGKEKVKILYPKRGKQKGDYARGVKIVEGYWK